MICLSDKQKEVLAGKLCPYCGRKTKFIDSSVVYGRSFGMIYLCGHCDAYCGVHRGTNKALGRVANKELREWKIKAHAAFDPLWYQQRFTRTEAYKWLSENLNIPIEYTHIGMFNVETCKKLIELIKNNL